jgi:hypothetical protein
MPGIIVAKNKPAKNTIYWGGSLANTTTEGFERGSQETPSAVYTPQARKPLKKLENIKIQSPKKSEKTSKNLLHYTIRFYIITKLVKCEEAGSYRASG